MSFESTYPFYQLDVFTDKAYYGNPLAVVVALDPSIRVPTDAQMARFANWTNLPETTFLLPPTDPTKADYKVRIFTPACELPFAGHPTLGACRVFLEYTKEQDKNNNSNKNNNKESQDGEGGETRTIVQECGVGLVELLLTVSDNKLAFVAPPLTKSGTVEIEHVKVACIAMGLDYKTDVLDTQWIVCGPEWFALILKDTETVLKASRLSTKESKKLVFGILARYEEDQVKDANKDPLFEVRTFPHALNDDEDPVTGSFNAGMAQWLIGTGLAPPNYVASQGTAMGRKGKIYVDRDASGNIWIGGQTVICIRGTVII
ncbi:hypothetical protein BGZ83_012000 [Gryganskiella cystojenkinii]|nr:hypothetical protein BGZ83_012000 [Gryganskiella cystojenkinii]